MNRKYNNQSNERKAVITMGETLTDGFSARSMFFFGLPSSKVFEDQPSVSEALTLAGLDFVVGKRPAFDKKNDDSYCEVPGKFVTYRMDTEATLGIVGSQYTPFDNEPALALCDELLGFGAQIDAAGSWHGGADVFISAQLQNGIVVPGEEDLDLHLLFRNNHAGTGSVSAYITPVRLQCTNMMSSALRKAVSSWKCRHTQTVADRVHEAAAAMELVDSYKVEYEATIQQLQETEFSMDEVDEFLKELTTAERVQKSIKDVYNTSETVTQGNGWGVFNAITEAIDHYPTRRTGPESRFASQLDGPLQRMRDRSMALLTRR